MIGKQENSQATLFIPGDIRDYIPDDHILARVDKVLDLSWFENEVCKFYSQNMGRPSIAPEAALRLMLAGFFLGIVHDRQLMREAQVNLAIRWFAGFTLQDRIPDHSSLTKIRQRWGEETFFGFFDKVVSQCIDAKLVSGETVHIDATLIRADVSWNAVARVHAQKVIEENESDSDPQPPRGGKKNTVCTTDPDAGMGRVVHENRSVPAYKQHTAVDDQSGVIVDVAVSTGSSREGRELGAVVGRVESRVGKVKTVTADKGYAGGNNYSSLESRGIDPLIIPQRPQRVNRSGVPIERFRYDANHNRVKCPGGRQMVFMKEVAKGFRFKAENKNCAVCPLRDKCLPKGKSYRQIVIPHGNDALLRARRRRQRGWSEAEEKLYTRHKHMVEGVHGEGKERHGLRRAVRRGMWNMEIQVYLTAIVINLKRLAREHEFRLMSKHDFTDSFFIVHDEVFAKNNIFKVSKAELFPSLHIRDAA